MKQIRLLMLLALVATSASHAAATPKKELSIAELDALHTKASLAAWNGNFSAFEEILNTCPDVVHHPCSACEEPALLTVTIRRHILEDRSAFIAKLLGEGVQLSSVNLLTCISFVRTSICLSHPEEVFTARLKALTSFYSLIESTPLPKDCVTDTVTTPRQWLQNYAKIFLEEKTCTRCDKPWAKHRPTNPDYKKRLREALELP